MRRAGFTARTRRGVGTLQGRIDVNESTGFPCRTWSGNPWDAFLSQAAAYRERFEHDGTALTRDEAATLYRLAPRWDPDPDEAERSAAVLRFSKVSPNTGRTYFNVERISGLLVAFDAEHVGEPSNTGRPCLDPEKISDMLTAFEAEHAGEPPIIEILAEPWERYLALRFLQRIINEDLISYPNAAIRELIARAVPILARERPVTRPRGRHNPVLNDRRDLLIRSCIEALEGCGLPVTTRGGDSLAGALAEALPVPVSERTIRKVWEGWQLRKPCVNDGAPAEFRMRESLIRRERSDPEKPPIAPGVRCARCDKPGQVPVYRAREGGTGLCTDCEGW